MLLAGDIEINPGPSGECPVCEKKFSKRAKTIVCEGCDATIHFMCQVERDPPPDSRRRKAEVLRMCPRCVDCTERYPCMSCHKGVTWSGKKSMAMQCDQCDQYLHIDCLNIGENTYRDLAQSSNLWFCQECGVPNHSDLIHSYNVSVKNSFAALEENISLDDYTELDSTMRSDTVLLEPQETSTPEVHRPTPPKKGLSRFLKIAVINFRGIVKNRDRLGAFLSSTDPDIIVGTETHLKTGDITPTELAEYDIERRDRDTVPVFRELSSGGGVVIAAKKCLLMSQEHELESDCEVMFSKINIAGAKTLHIGAFYRHDVSDNTSLNHLAESLARIPRSHSVVLGGDFNLPGITYDQENGPHLKLGARYIEHHEGFLDMMTDMILRSMLLK